MKFVIRTDSSSHIGSGHMMRCLTLAEALRRIGADVSFICRELPGNVAHLAAQMGFTVHLLNLVDYAGWEEDACKTAAIVRQGQMPDWLIVDHYSLDARWERSMRPFVQRVMIIDDLANREHDCDLLLDANFYLQPEGRYNKLVPAAARLLLGKAGDILTPQNLRIIRPGLGLPPKYWEVVLGKRVNRDLSQGTPLQWEHL